jgi:hypothetical protein
MDRNFRNQVSEWAHHGVPFELIESRIEALEGLTGEERSALWLWAWSFQAPQRQRYMARKVLEGLDARREPRVMGE